MKKLKLSNNRMLLGVCGGLGEYFVVDPFWFRLMFVLGFMYKGSGFGVYLIMWAIIAWSSKE